MIDKIISRGLKKISWEGGSALFQVLYFKKTTFILMLFFFIPDLANRNWQDQV